MLCKQVVLGKLITRQKALDERRQGQRPAAEIPAVESRDPPPALHQQRGIAAREPLHQVAVLGICRLLSRGQNHNAGLRAQEGGQEVAGAGIVTQACGEPPGGAGGVAIVVEVEMADGLVGEAGEGIHVAGSQGKEAVTSASATGVAGLASLSPRNHPAAQAPGRRLCACRSPWAKGRGETGRELERRQPRASTASTHGCSVNATNLLCLSAFRRVTQ